MIKDIMVHLDGSPEDEIRLEHGQAIASIGRAHLVGVFTNLLPELTMAMPMDGGAAMIQALSEFEDRAREEGDAHAERLMKRLSDLQTPSEFRRLDATFAGLSASVAAQARCADLFIATRPDGRSEIADWTDLVEAVIFGSGRAVLLVPPGRRPQGPIQTVLIAWNGSRESARALREGLDLISQATRTIVLIVDPSPDAAASVKAHLAHHGVVVEIATVQSGDRRIADVILEEARRVSADIVVMGAYGHSRLREQIFGGATRDMLAASDRPILLAH